MEIDELIMKDLAIYDQDNLYPKTLTVVEGKLFRHYELGPIYGFCIYNQITADGSQWFGLMSLEEDDEFWFIPSHGMNIAASWCNDINETWKRTVDWFNEYILEGWRDDENYGNPAFWVSEIKKPIVPELVEHTWRPSNLIEEDDAGGRTKE